MEHYAANRGEVHRRRWQERSISMTQQQLTREDIQKWIIMGQYEFLFMFSCSYQFAIVIHEEYGLALRGLRRQSGALNHVWGGIGYQAVDFHGVRFESEVVRGYTDYVREPLEVVDLMAVRHSLE